MLNPTPSVELRIMSAPDGCVDAALAGRLTAALIDVLSKNATAPAIVDASGTQAGRQGDNCK
jgi:hypothetical protein